MPNVSSLPVRTSPRITFSALVDVLTSPAHRLQSILSPHKYPRPGPVFGYKKATEQLVNWFVNGTALNPQDPTLREHESDALLSAQSLPGAPAALLPAGTVTCTEPASEPTWQFEGVEVSFFPDLLVRGTPHGQPASGAVKLFLRKDPTAVGPMLAALLYFHRSQVARDPNVDPSLCAITDVQAGVVYTATGNFQRLVGQAQNACLVVAAIWPSV